jgi:hypothetical protein
MGKALNLYLDSSVSPKPRFAMLAQTAMWGRAGAIAAILHRDIGLMAHQDYMKVLGNRPLYYMGFITEDDIKNRWGGIDGLKLVVSQIQASVLAQTGNRPYVVLLDFSPTKAAEWAIALGCDAIGTYASSGVVPTDGSFDALTKFTEGYWNAQLATGVPVVPTVMTGWDRRPRIFAAASKVKNPEEVLATAKFYEPGTPEQIADALGRCIHLVYNNTNMPAQTVLVYAWNENDEGGWIVPTLTLGNSRLAKIKQMLEGVTHGEATRLER